MLNRGKYHCGQVSYPFSLAHNSAPSQKAVTTIQEMQHFVISPIFLVYHLPFITDFQSYAGVLILIAIALALWVAPKYGSKVLSLNSPLIWQTMLVYLSICSLIGSLSVVATQGLGLLTVEGAECRRRHRCTGTRETTIQSVVSVCFVGVCSMYATSGDYLPKCTVLSGAC